jgi:hypothetical protein
MKEWNKILEILAGRSCCRKIADYNRDAAVLKDNAASIPEFDLFYL